MSKFLSFLGTIAGLALLAAMLYGGYLLFLYVAGVFATLEHQVATLAGIASAVALLCAIIIAEGLRAQGQRAAGGLDSLERSRLYERLLQQPPGPERAATERSMALRASAPVIAAYVKCRDANGADGATLLQALVAEMRKDLGYRDASRLTAGLLGSQTFREPPRRPGG